MKRAVTIGPGQIEFRGDFPEPRAGPGEVVVAVESVGICGSDMHVWTGHHPYFRYPGVQGHEFGGRIVALGDGVADSGLIGERVAVEPLFSCGSCIACRRGRQNCCVRLRVMGSHVDGALAERLVVPASLCYPVGDLDSALTALVEPMSIGLQAVARSGIGAGDRVVIIGAGPIGQAILLGATERGAVALVADRIPARLDLASAFGADFVVDTTGDDLGESVSRWTDGDGPVAVFEATGVPAVARAAVDMVAASGTVVIVGLSQAEVSLPLLEFTRKELTVVGSRNNAGQFAPAVALVRRRRDVIGRLVTHRFPFDRAADAMNVVIANPGAVGKVLIDVSDARGGTP